MTAHLLGAFLTGALCGGVGVGMVVLVVWSWLDERIDAATTLPGPDDRTVRMDPLSQPLDLPRRSRREEWL